MKYSLVAIGVDHWRNEIPKAQQSVYTLVQVRRFKHVDVFANATEAEAVTLANLINTGALRYDTDKGIYYINGTGSNLYYAGTDNAMCYIAWVNDRTDHIHFCDPTLFADDNFEPVMQDCSRRYVYSSASHILTTEIAL